MKDIPQQKLENEILSVTSRIEKEFPELYKLLIETPLFLSYNKSRITTAELEEYLISLRSQLSTFEKNEQGRAEV